MVLFGMSNRLDVLCIDGATGVGKTTQIILFRNLLKSLGIETRIFSLKEVDDIQYTRDQLIGISEYLKENPESVVLVDGSMATDIVDDVVRNMLKEDIWDRHQSNLQLYESLNNNLNFVNILLTPIDITMCHKRITKRTDVYRESQVDLENVEHLRRTSIALENFDNSTLAINIKFHNIRVDNFDSMLDIHNGIKDIIKNSNHILETKKPS